MPSAEPYPTCGYAKMVCVENALIHTNIERCDCFPACTEIYYTAKSSMTYFPHKTYKGSIRQVSSEFQFTKKIRYEWITKTEIIANIGGVFGVLVGFSMISLFEIIYFGFIYKFKEITIRDFRLKKFFKHKKLSTFQRSMANEINRIANRTEMFMFKNILRSKISWMHRSLWILVTIGLIYWSFIFVNAIWLKSFADPIIVSLSKRMIPTSMVNHRN